MLVAQKHLIVCQLPTYQGRPAPVTQNLRLACDRPETQPFVGSLPSLGSGSRASDLQAIAPGVYLDSPGQPLGGSLFRLLDAATSAFFSPTSSPLCPGPRLCCPLGAQALACWSKASLTPTPHPNPICHFSRCDLEPIALGLSLLIWKTGVIKYAFPPSRSVFRIN